MGLSSAARGNPSFELIDNPCSGVPWYALGGIDYTDTDVTWLDLPGDAVGVLTYRDLPTIGRYTDGKRLCVWKPTRVPFWQNLPC